MPMRNTGRKLVRQSVPNRTPRKINIAAKSGSAHQSCSLHAKKLVHGNSHNRMKTKNLAISGIYRTKPFPASHPTSQRVGKDAGDQGHHKISNGHRSLLPFTLTLHTHTAFKQPTSPASAAPSFPLSPSARLRAPVRNPSPLHRASDPAARWACRPQSPHPLPVRETPS